MMKFMRTIICYVLMAGMLISILPKDVFAKVIENPDLSYNEGVDIIGQDSMSDEPGPEDIPGFTDPYTGPKVDPVVNQLKEVFNTSTFVAPTPSQIAQKFDTTRIILNTSDKRDLDQYIAISKVLPDLETDFNEFARLSGEIAEDLEKMYYEDYDSFTKLRLDTENRYFDNEYINSFMFFFIITLSYDEIG